MVIGFTVGLVEVPLLDLVGSSFGNHRMSSRLPVPIVATASI
jgi:hypothetical protein